MAIAISSLASTSALATNGMNLEGYGAKATAMGGAGMAYDTGNSAVMNNPATLALMEPDTSRFGLGIRSLGPDITSSVPSMGISTNSDGTAYYMPSISLMRKTGKLTYGAAVLAQGGMGTEYGSGSELFSGGLSMMGAMTPLSGEEIRSEVGVGRLMFPLAYEATPKLSVGGSVDFVWAGMDLQMDMDGTNFAGLMGGMGGSVSGSMATGLSGMISSGMITDVNWARFDFSNDSDISGKARGYGLGGKLGVVFEVNDRLSIGAAYHTETDISDLKADDASISMSVEMPGMGTTVIPVSGTVKIRDFQWPATYGIGAAFKATDKLLIVGDIKRLDWSNVMEEFKVNFVADGTQANPMAGGFAGADLDVTLTQEWDDQTIYSLGMQYQATPKLALRAGVNVADNPVPDMYLNPLFPAIVEEHYTFGAGYKISDSDRIAFSATIAPDVTATNPAGAKVRHSQFNWSLNYSHTF